MNKRIMSIVLAFVLAVGVLATALTTFAGGSTCTFTVEANKSEAYRGDEILFTVYMQQTGKQNTMEFTVKVPSALTYVANSGTAADNISATLNWTGAGEGAGWTESSMYFSGFGAQSYQGTDKIALMTFKCTVKNDAAFNNHQVTLVDYVADDDSYKTKNPTVVPATISVVEKPVPVTGVTIDETLSLKTGESASKTPTFAVQPENATNKAVSFTSSDPSVATVDATTGKVTGIKEGQATITIKTADGGFTDTCTVTVACSHANKTDVPEQDSDCKTPGWDAYVKCEDCGQLFEADGTTEIDSTPYRALSDQHTGGTATCTSQAVCTVCGEPYGQRALHSYTAAEKKKAALKSEGNCRDEAVYFYSCSACHMVESDANHTFKGEKDATKHVGGTQTVNAAPANHKTQTAGYTGDTQCVGCQTILDYGTAIAPGEHTAGSTYQYSGTEHWKVCNQSGCGVEITGSRGTHTSTGNNVATCQKLAKCDVCGVEYGSKAGHDWASEYSKDATGHWYACKTTGCTEKNTFEAHTPDHQGAPSDEYAIKCTKCQYVIHAQLQHTHVFDKQVATKEHLATEADCKNAATYFKSCKCGQNGTQAFASGGLGDHKWDEATCSAPKTCSVCDTTEGEAVDHAPGTEWKTDKDSHWHICKFAGCEVVIDSSKAAHEFGTEWKSDKDNHWNECVCGLKANEAAHADADKDGKCDTCKYNVGTPSTGAGATGSAPSSPQTGDGAMTFVWIAILMMSGLGAAIFVTNEKKRVK